MKYGCWQFVGGIWPLDLFSCVNFISMGHRLKLSYSVNLKWWLMKIGKNIMNISIFSLKLWMIVGETYGTGLLWEQFDLFNKFCFSTCIKPNNNIIHMVLSSNFIQFLGVLMACILTGLSVDDYSNLHTYKLLYFYFQKFTSFFW